MLSNKKIDSMKRTWVNGEETTHISVYDRGLQYGDGLFETMRMLDGDVALWPDHVTRLQQGCQRLGIAFDRAYIEEQLAIVKTQVVTGVVKLIVTRGESERGYRVSLDFPVNIVWMCSELPVYPDFYYTQGVDILFCTTTISRNTSLAGLKHLNRLEHVLARREWQDEFQEGLMCDDQSHVIEGTMTNVFFVENDILVTPDIQYCGVDGVMRQRILNFARDEGIRTQTRNITPVDLEFFDSVLLTNSLIGAWPVNSIDGQGYAITPLAKHLVAHVRPGQN